MDLHAEQLQHEDGLPKFASTSVSADFIRNYLLLNVRDRVLLCFSNVHLLPLALPHISLTSCCTKLAGEKSFNLWLFKFILSV